LFKAFSYKAKEVQKLKDVVIINPCIIWVLSGMKNISLGRYKYNLKNGDAILLGANSKLNFENIPINGLFFSKQIIFFKPPKVEFFKQTVKNFEVYKYRHIKLDYQLKMTLDLLHQSDVILKNINTRHMWLDGLYLLLAEEYYLQVLFLSSEDSFNEKVYEVLEKMQPSDHKIENVCSILGVSKATLIRRLKKAGTQFKKIVRQVRMNKALFLMQKRELLLEDISFSCGYQSVELLVVYFKEEFGITPKEYFISFKDVQM
jgi:AraC-like DNA-binding protein